MKVFLFHQINKNIVLVFKEFITWMYSEKKLVSRYGAFCEC